LTSNSFDDLFAWAESLGITLSHAQQENLALFVREVWAWQKKMNLVGVTTKDRVIRELLLDSLVPLPHIPQTGSLLDLGSGAGFPAIPLKICLPDVHFQLLEPTNRKAVFLRQIIRLLDLGRIEVITARIEDSGETLASHEYGTITARAVASLPRALQWCGPYLARKGLLISFQGSSWKEVLEESAEIMREQKLVLSRTLPYRLPGKTGERVILFFTRKDTSQDLATPESGLP